MKNLQIRFFALFLFISLFNTAFIFQSTTNIEQKTALTPLEVPPQYKTQKLSFFDRLILKRILKKSTPQQTINLDAAVKDTNKFAVKGLALLVLSPLVFFLPLGGFIMSIIMIITSLVLSIMAIGRGNFVLNHPEVTKKQAQEVKKAKITGYCSLISGVIFIVLIVLLLRSFLL